MSSKFKRAVLIYLVVNLLYVLAVLFIVQDNSLAMLDRMMIVLFWAVFNAFASISAFTD